MTRIEKLLLDICIHVDNSNAENFPDLDAIASVEIVPEAGGGGFQANLMLQDEYDKDPKQVQFEADDTLEGALRKLWESVQQEY